MNISIFTYIDIHFFPSSCAEVNGYWHIKLKYIINDQTWFGKGWLTISNKKLYGNFVK